MKNEIIERKKEVLNAIQNTDEKTLIQLRGERVPRDEVKHRLSKYHGVTNCNKQIKNATTTDQSKSCI